MIEKQQDISETTESSMSQVNCAIVRKIMTSAHQHGLQPAFVNFMLPFNIVKRKLLKATPEPGPYTGGGLAIAT